MYIRTYIYLSIYNGKWPKFWGYLVPDVQTCKLWTHERLVQHAHAPVTPGRGHHGLQRKCNLTKGLMYVRVYMLFMCIHI